MSWWIAVSEHTLSERVPAPPTTVRDFYVDLDNLKQLHPFLVDVEKTQRTTLPAGGYRQSYRVRERIPLGPTAITIRFSAELTVPADGPVTSVSRQFPRIVLNSTMSFDADGPGTRVVEHLTIAAPRPLAAFTVREGVEAHVKMLAGIRAHFQ